MKKGSKRETRVQKRDSRSTGGQDKTTGVQAHSREATLAKARDEREGKWSTKKKVILGVIIGFVAIIIALALAFMMFFNSVSNNIRIADSDALAALEKTLVVPEVDKPYYALLIGSDSRDEGNALNGRSDTIMLVRVDSMAKQVTVLSIPRDTKVELEGYGTQKINAAFTYGGEAGAVEAVSKLCGVDIAHYADIDFSGVVNLVDRLGGIDVEVPVNIDLDGTFIPAGYQHLDGYQTLIMSRCRSFPTGDFQRVQNQRIILQAVAGRVLAASPLEMPGLIESLSDCLATDVSAPQAAQLLIDLNGMSAEHMYMATIPTTFGTDPTISYVEVVEPDFGIMMDRVKAGLPPVDPNVVVDPSTALPSQTVQ